MRILANENCPRVAVDALRRAGHDVAWVRSDAPGSSDDVVLARALREVRILVTFDKDFDEMVFRRGAAASCGIVLFRIPPMTPDALAAMVVEALSAQADWAGQFAIVEPGRLRVRRLS